MTEFIQFLPDLIVAYSAYLIATLSPGPAVLAIMGTSMSRGRRAGVSLAAGVSLGSFIWSLLAAFGVTAFLAAFGWTLIAVKIGGGLYLLWLAYKSLRSALRKDTAAEGSMPAAQNDRRFFLRGVAVHMTNPKAVFAWIAIISLGLRPDSPLWVTFAIIGGCAALGILVFGFYALAFSSAPMIRLYQSGRRIIDGTLAVFFGAAGLKLLTSRL
ncbi:MAG: LysE family translocator [Sneathiella sp.]|uniref:LysE family translocator n=1 Tax=Sneathiella sp. TaxID=1964365 RepID=UPI00300219CB